IVGFVLLTITLAFVGSLISRPTTLAVTDSPASLLLQVRDDEGRAVHSFAVLRKGQTWLQLDPDLMLTTETTVTSLADAASGLNLNSPKQWFADTYGLKFEETWVIDRVGLNALVDLIGGVSVQPDADVMLRLGEKPVLYVSKSENIRLDGTAASIYATSSEARPQRFQQVWNGLMAEIDAAYLESVLPAVGNSSRSSMVLAKLIQWIEFQQLLTAEKKVDWLQAKTELGLIENQYQPILRVAAIEQMAALGMERVNP
ncbi:MAG: hypothetical protein RL038_1249, partial [Actinomycetota bacterium]